MDELKVGDLVFILHEGEVIAEGKIVNINDLRPPEVRYAVHVEGFEGDIAFLRQEKLKKK